MNTGQRRMINTAVGKAIDFLVTSCGKEGCWHDFPSMLSGSDEWVTAYVGTVLARSGDQGRQAAQTAWKNFSFRHAFEQDAGWGYRPGSPVDGDSTTWGLKFACNLGLWDKPRALLARAFLQKHLTPEGGITSFIREYQVRQWRKLTHDDSVEGWCSTHTCVTAAAATLPGFNRILTPFLQSAQRANGEWKSYWWTDDAYATAFAAEALKITDNETSSKPLRRALLWVMSRLANNAYIATETFPEGSPFVTALSLKTLAYGNSDESHQTIIHSVAEWLLNKQRDDGSWQPSAWLQTPPPAMVSPVYTDRWIKEKGADWGTITLDEAALFTTATVLDTFLILLKH